MSRQLTLLLCTLAVVAGCSRNPERPVAASPTAPSASTASAPESLLGPTSVAPRGISGKFDVSFPPRNDSFQFRNELETIYRDILRRGTSPTVVDREGEVVWTQEYIRYRVNGCDHITAASRVLAQIAGGAAAGVCGAPPLGLILFPSRTDSFQFRSVLESTYEAMGRGQSGTSVDSEGGVIWTQEYLRYRVNSCDHPTSVQKVASQISGGPVPDTCFVPACAFTVSTTSQSVPAAGGTFTFTVTKAAGSTCTYSVESLGSFVSITGGASGTQTATVTYTVAQNTGPARSAPIRVRWTNASQLIDVNQAGSALNSSFVMVDPAQSTAVTTVCQIRSTATQCRFTASANTTTTSTFAWTATYLYPSLITHTQSSTSNVFTFTQACGGSSSSPGGTDTPLNVTLTVTDPNSGSETVTSGSGNQPALTIKLFTC